MTWTSKIKDLDLHKVTPHGNAFPGVTGRAPAFVKIKFGPLDLFGAAARCSHLSAVNPLLATPESNIIAALLEQYVDDVASDFAIMRNANFKDFVKSYFAGTVAAGVAYLAMINDGYVWSNHFENLTGGNPSASKTPDFVFAGPTTGTALMESKGTRSAGVSAFDGTVSNGYIDQVDPHLGYSVGGSVATHGYCIGSWLTSTTKAELLVHHTAVPVTGGGSGSGSPASSIQAIQRQNYATAFSLAHSAQLGEELRDDGVERNVVRFVSVSWAGRRWLTSLRPVPGLWWLWWQELSLRHDLDPPFGEHHHLRDQSFFAVDQHVAEAVLLHFHARSLRIETGPLSIEPLPRDLRYPTAGDGSAQAGAIFPDGLAVIRSGFQIEEVIIWDPRSGRFEPT